MLNKENVKDYLNAIAATRNIFIIHAKASLYAYKSELSKIAVDYTAPVFDDDDDLSDIDKLTKISVNPMVFNYLDESEYNVGIAFDDERWERKWLVIDGITLESHIFKPSEAMQDA